MSNTHIPISLQTNLWNLDTTHLDFDANVMRYKSSVTSSPKSFGTGDIGLTTKEVKALHKSLLSAFVDDEDIVAKLSRDDILVKNSTEEDGDASHRLVILTVYEGEAPPPTCLRDLDYSSVFKKSNSNGATGEDVAAPASVRFDEWSKFKRSSLPSGTQHSSPPHQRWFRIHGTQRAESEVEHENDNAIFDMKGVRFYLIPIKIRCIRLCVEEALYLHGNMNGSNPDVGVVESKYVELGGRVVNIEGRTLSKAQAEQVSQSRNFPGVNATIEPIFRVRVRCGEGLLMSQTPQLSVSLKSDHKNLSDIVMEHCGPSLHRLQSSEGIEMLTAKFKGIRVGKRTSGGYEYRTIRAFKMGTVSDVLPRERHNAWPSESGLILSPSLPLVDVGTVKGPLYLPMEVCCIPEKQSMHGPKDFGLTKWANATLRTNSVADLPKICQDVRGTLVFHQYRQDNDLNQTLERVCGAKLPNLMFVEAGSTVASGDGWSQLRNELRESFSYPSAAAVSQSDNSMPLLTLRYTSGSDPSTKWTQQLQDFVTACNKSGQKPIIVVSLESEQDHSVMYKIIKRACEVTIGVQTFFVKRETYAAQMYLKPHLKRSSTEIRRRICQKNPQMLKATNGEDPTLAIAMHVAKVATIPPHARPAGQQQVRSSVYLVTLVSRDPVGSRHYHTEQGLFTESQLRSHKHVKLLQGFFKLAPQLSTMKVVILRSGTMLLPPTPLDTSAKCDLTNSASFNSSDTSISGVEEDDDRRSSPAYYFNPSSEIEAIRDEFDSQSSLLTYITLTEDKTLATRLDLPTYYAAQPGNKAPAILFIQDHLLVQMVEFAVKVQQVPRVLLSKGQETSEKTVQTNPGAITATFHRSYRLTHTELTPRAEKSLTVPNGDRMKKASSANLRADSQTPRPKTRSPSIQSQSTPLKGVTSPASAFKGQQPQTPTRMLEGADMPSDDFDPYDFPDVTTTTEIVRDYPVRSRKQTSSEDNVSKADMDYLVGIWKDDELGLYSTQWPIPTHLAHLATKRAMTRLRTDDWENTTTAPFSLTAVHKNVRDTLYYL
jgi:hypothetical protein